MRRMSGGGGVKFSLFKGGASGTLHEEDSREIQELWFSLAKLRWSSLVLVPADVGISASSVATSLADVGSRLRDTPVAAIVADEMDYESARMLAELELRVQDDRGVSGLVAVEHAAPSSVSERPADPQVAPGDPGAPGDADPNWRRPGRRAADGEARGSPEPSSTHSFRALPPSGRLVIAIQPVIVEPLGVAVARAADAVVLCIQLGETHLKAAKKTIELIGADRIAGAFIVR